MSALSAAEDVFDLLGYRQRTVERQNRVAIQLLRDIPAREKGRDWDLRRERIETEA
jgi:hypothetical protein